VANIYGYRKDAKVGFVRGLADRSIQIGSQTYSTDDLNTSLAKFQEHFNLLETIQRHGYLRAAMSVVGKSTIGSWWNIRKHAEYGDKARDGQRKRLYEFYMFKNRQWDNIKDYQSIAYKLMIGAMYLRYFGRAAYQIVRNEVGTPLGFDFLPGLVLPNVDREGYFKEPAFVQYPSATLTDRVEFEDPRDIIYVVNPDWSGSAMGGSDIEALTTYVLPIDLYLMLGAREYLKNRDKPEVIYSLPPDISDEAFDAFVREMEARRSGMSNLGRNPIAIQGEFDVKELEQMPDGLPYQDSRKDARDEELAVAGVTGAKLGLSEYMTNANLRELRREFHETSLVPLFIQQEISFYEQIHVREFRYPGWEFKFNSPDFLNLVEKATVHMRYWQIGVMNPNEIRHERGLPARSDDMGDIYRDQLLTVVDDLTDDDPQGDITMPGTPPEGREEDPGAPAAVGEPNMDDPDPVRGDQHDETPRESMISELRQWRTFALKRKKRGKSVREFNTVYIPAEVRRMIQSEVSKASSCVELAIVFEEAVAAFEEALYAE
jgi:hypothetical protein